VRWKRRGRECRKGKEKAEENGAVSGEVRWGRVGLNRGTREQG